MKHSTLASPARFTRAQLIALRDELERERGRLDAADARHHVYSEALRRLDDGTYGACLGCGTAIPFGRLSVMPETAFCMPCGAR